jgi:spoIIIJ-associated protein
MTHFIEFEGKNVELAVTRACETLNIPRDRLRHEVISFGATGIFGLVGVKKARIRVAAPQIPDDGADAAMGPCPDAFADFRDASDAAPQRPAPAPDPDPEAEGLAAHSLPALSEPAELGTQILRRLVDSVVSGAQIGVNCSSRRIVYTIDCEDPAPIIGKRGQTIEAIQYLLKKIVAKSTENRIPIVIDIAGQALKRQADLQALALRIAEKACQDGKSVTVGRFNPHDRKIIHLALKNDIRVRTQSKGEGYLKKLAVVPREA